MIILIKTNNNLICQQGIFLDLSKACGTLNYDILLEKLQHKYGTIKWIILYLDKKIQIKTRKIISDGKYVNPRILHRRVLGQILFLCYISLI